MSSYLCWIGHASQGFTTKLKFVSWLGFTFQTQKIRSNYHIKTISHSPAPEAAFLLSCEGKVSTSSWGLLHLPASFMAFSNGALHATRTIWILYSSAWAEKRPGCISPGPGVADNLRQPHSMTADDWCYTFSQHLNTALGDTIKWHIIHKPGKENKTCKLWLVWISSLKTVVLTNKKYVRTPSRYWFWVAGRPWDLSFSLFILCSPFTHLYKQPYIRMQLHKAAEFLSVTDRSAPDWLL